MKTLAVLGLLCVATAYAADKCPVQPPDQCPGCDCVGDKFPHPVECEWYYVCNDKGLPELTQCADGLHYNKDKEICDYPCYAGCQDNGPEVTEPPPVVTEEPPPVTEEPPPSGGGCPAGEVPQCPNPDPELSVFFPHPNDCHWFYHCSNGVAYCKECPADLHWNVQLETCDYPERAGCDVSQSLHRFIPQ